MNSPDLMQAFFPEELMSYFTITKYELLCNIELKQEYWLIDFEEKNEVPNGYLAGEYESKGFTESAIIQDFPLVANLKGANSRQRGISTYKKTKVAT